MKKMLLPFSIILVLFSVSGKPITPEAPRPAGKKVMHTALCGPGFVVDNTSGYTVTRIDIINNSGGGYTYTNPTFPIFVPEGSGGDYTITVRCSDRLLSGSLKVSDGTQTIGCQLFDTRIFAYDIYFGCGQFYITITSDYNC